MAGLIPLDEALRLALDLARPLPAESVPLAQAHDRTLAEPVVAAIASPRSDSSAMDGYAVRDADVAWLPVKLRVAGESFAGTGETPALESGEAVRIFTGAPLPEGADRVVVQENCSREGDLVTIHDPGIERYIRRAGQDFGVGEVLLPAGTRLGPRALVAAACSDVAELCVVRRPCAAILATGDELVSPGEARQRPGAIPESISPAIAAMVVECGGEVVRRVHLADDLPRMAKAARRAVEDADLVIVTGGASVGERDHAKAMFGEGLELLFSKVAIKPGRPAWFGRTGGTLLLGLPGNPTSAMVAARLFLVPLVSGLAGRTGDTRLHWREGLAGAPFAANGSREALVRAKWEEGRLVPLSNQDSSSQSVLAQAEILVRREVGAPELRQGQNVSYLPF